MGHTIPSTTANIYATNFHRQIQGHLCPGRRICESKVISTETGERIAFVTLPGFCVKQCLFFHTHKQNLIAPLYILDIFRSLFEALYPCLHFFKIIFKVINFWQRNRCFNRVRVIIIRILCHHTLKQGNISFCDYF